VRRTGDFKAAFNLARLLSARGRIEDAIELYRVAARAENKAARADALNNLGIMSLKRSNVTQALDCFRKASERTGGALRHG
jgi:tetratricopeptide (TPR) repeat protein